MGGLIPRVRDCGTVCPVCRYTREERGKRVVAFYREPLRCIGGTLVAPYGRRELFDKWMTPELLFIVRAKLLEISRFAEISLSLSFSLFVDGLVTPSRVSLDFNAYIGTSSCLIRRKLRNTKPS